MEVDYQTALLLQYKLEQEHRRKQDDTKSDHQLALQLQEQFNTEGAIERPSNNLVYKAPTNANTSKCLVDPSWEVIDPTPDVHTLFIAFDQKFFWNKLGSVTVAWSKRMTTCAGICSYQGHGGMCSITLSEPLLKLRPRKDLVETLLHEMIHAYLFVTHNNRDRDGHGPEFHKHMYRINAEAGTNITVYHDFHDEVRLYQQHWWRCDGPCQHRKPYFGMVRRATNRAPGPNDRWWNEHKANCGGNFIKVKSPEAPTKPAKTKESKSKKTDNTNNDIRKYITGQTKETPAFKKPERPRLNSLPNNVQTVTNSTESKSKVSNVIPTKTANIHGFTNLAGGSKKPATRVKGAVKNAGSSVLVVTKKGAGTTTPSAAEPAPIQPFAGVGRSLSSSSLSNRDYSTVREHWLKKFESKQVKRSNSVEQPQPKCKQPKLKEVECPVCNRQVDSESFNQHLDQCLEAGQKDTKQCIICLAQVACGEYESHVTYCTEQRFEMKVCPACNNEVTTSEYGKHLQNCIKTLCEEDVTTRTPCLACGKNILKSELNSHLEDCLSMTNVFDTSNVPVEDAEDLNRTYNCPFCLQLIDEGGMQKHIDECLKSTEGVEVVDLLLSADSDDD